MVKKKLNKKKGKSKTKALPKDFYKVIRFLIAVVILVVGIILIVPKFSSLKPAANKNQKIMVHGQVVRKTAKLYKNNIVKQYKFYVDGKVIATQNFKKDGSFSRASGVIPDGLVREYYDNNTVKAEANYENNKRQGTEAYYYENGPLMAVLYFDKEKLFPKADVYYDNGALHSQWRYVPATKSGYALFYFKDGRLGVQSACNSGQEFLNLVGAIQLGS